MSTLLQDLRYGLRVLMKSPGFSLIAILTLALGIGANTAIFSFVNAWVIKPLSYPQSDRLMTLLSHDKKKGWTSNGVTSTADFYDYQKLNTAFEQLVAYTSAEFNLTGDGPPEQVIGGRVSWSYFQTLGVRPVLGRTFLQQEDQPGTGHVAILSSGLWKSRFAGDPNVVGRTVTIDGESYSIVGVMPGNFVFPLMGEANLWTPLALTTKERAGRGNSLFEAFGRLKPGVTQAQAGTEITGIASRLEKLYPRTNTNQTTLLSPTAYEIGKEQGNQQVMMLFWIVGLVLLIACANVANLMLARASRRTKEIAVRGALGASRIRLVRQLLTESLLLFFFGGVAGAFFGAWGLNWIEAGIPGRIRGYLVNFGYVSLDIRTLCFTLGIALLCGLIFGLAPAFESSGLDLNRALKEASGQASRSGRGARMRRIFVGGEIALAVVVLISTTLLVKSFVRITQSDLGFRPANVMSAQLELPKTKYSAEAQIRNFYEQALARIRALPQVNAAGGSEYVPFGGDDSTAVIHVVGRPSERPGEEIGAEFSAVTPEYFPAMQIPLLQGRGFTMQDGPDAARAVVINQTLARQQWPNKNPVGEKLEFGEQHTVCTVIGVVQDVKMFTQSGRPRRQIYVPFAQFPQRHMAIVARSSRDASALAAPIRDAIWSVDADQPVSLVRSLDDLIIEQNAGNRIVAQLVSFFGALALFLGALGIYGVMAHTVAQRTHEIGIRMALGAEPRQVMRLVIAQGLKLTSIGIAVGVVVALGATRLLAFQLYQVKAVDPVTFVAVPVVFAIVAIAACYIPARRAMRTDPMVALRYE